MGKIIFIVAYIVLQMVFGAWCISNGIENFKEKKYFSFGIDLIIVVLTIINLADMFIQI